jgi:HEPN domain-containing protein
MADERILDAAALISQGRWAFAYYVAGYAVECALKSCVLARMVHTGAVFEDKKFAERCFTHDFGELVKLAGLKNELDAKLAASSAFVGFWGTATLWKETSRYEEKAEPEARSLYEAISHDPDGVLRWIRNYW